MTTPRTSAPAAARAPKLAKVLGLGAVVTFGLAYMMPMASFTTFGVVNTTTEGHIVTSYLVTLVAMLFTAAAYAAMSRAFPVTGAAYSYTRRTLGAHAGFLGGWTILLDYVLLPMMAYLVIGVYLHAAFPGVPQAAWIAGSIVLVTVLNSLGVRVLARINSSIVAAQTLFLLVVGVLALKAIAGTPVPSIADVILGSGPGIGTVFGGAAILCYSFLGFDAVSSLAEETRDASRTIPRAIMLVTLIGGLIFIVISLLSNLAFPDWRAYTNADAAALDVAFAVGGRFMEIFFTAAFVAGCFGAVMSQQATVSRMLYSMGRDGVLPTRVFGTLSRRFQTPVRATLVVAAVGFISILIDLSFASQLINFGALTAFSLVNIAVVKHYVIDRGERGGYAMLRYLVVPLAGLGLTLWLWTSLSLPALAVGVGWVVLGAVYLAFLTKGFTRKPPELGVQ